MVFEACIINELFEWQLYHCEIKLHFDVMIMMTDSNVLDVLRLV